MRTNKSFKGTIEESEQRVKLAAAFKAMRKAGLTARQNFACCQSCGCYEIGSAPKSKFMYAFYHRQDEDGRVRGHNLYIAYGSKDVNDETLSKQAGEIVRKCLQEAGLNAEWDGDINKRIMVKGFNV